MDIAAPISRSAPWRPPPAAGWRDARTAMIAAPPGFLAPLLQHPVAVFGGATSGSAVETLLTQLGARGVVFDERPDIGTAHAFTATEAAAHRLVVFSPGSTPATPGCKRRAPPAAPVSGNSISPRCSGPGTWSPSPAPMARRRWWSS